MSNSFLRTFKSLQNICRLSHRSSVQSLSEGFGTVWVLMFPINIVMTHYRH